MDTQLNSIDEWITFFDTNKDIIMNYIDNHKPDVLEELISARDNYDYFRMFTIIQEVWLSIDTSNINVNRDLEGWHQLNVLLNNILYK